jgi:hypothetical protein
VKRIVISFFVFTTINAVAQSRNEVGLLLGGTILSSPSTTAQVNLNSGLSYQATYARWLRAGESAGIAIEVPFIAVPSQDVSSTSPIAPRNYASIFITPGLRFKFVPGAALAPWFSVGGGYARFAESTTLVTGQPNTFKTGTNKGALQYGGGIDIRSPFKFPLPIGFRVEIRDFYTGQPRLNVPTTNNGQHNIVVSGGLVLHF